MTSPTHVTNIALVGATGQVGSHILRHLLLSPTPFNITILTRSDSNATMPAETPNLKIARVDYTSHASLTTALLGTQLLIISLSVFSPAETQRQLIDAAASTSSCRYIIPNEWGTDWTDPIVNKSALLGDAIVANREYIVSKSLKWISVSCGFWYEYSLGSGAPCYGFDLREIPGKAYLFDGGETPINTSTWNHVGEGVAAMLRLPIHPPPSPASANGAPTNGHTKTDLSIEGTFANSFLRLSSFTLTQTSMLDSLCRVTSTMPAQWDVTTVPTSQWVADGHAQLKTGNRAGFGKVLYGSVMEAVPERNGGFAACYQAHKGLHDEVLGLKPENLDEATGRAVEIARGKVERGEYWG